MGNELPAGRELDALIAEKVMGLEVIKSGAECSMFTPGARWVPGGEYYELPVLLAVESGTDPADVNDPYLAAYTTDIAAAWRVVEKLRAQGVYLDVRSESAAYGVSGFDRSKNQIIASHRTPTAPLAICRAALAAVESEVRNG